MSDKILGNRSLDTFDVLVIGSGAGGGPVADLCTRHGKKVLVIEAGPSLFDNLDRADAQPISRSSNDEVKRVRGFFDPSTHVDPRTFRVNEAAGERTLVGEVNVLPKVLGGGTVHADLQMPRFAPVDFKLGTMLGNVPGAAFADWPVSYDALEPFYEFTERTIGIQGKRGSDPFAGPMKNEYPMPPGAKMYLSTFLESGAKKLGYTVFPYPTAVNSRPYDGRPACVDCGFCSHYQCPNNAKGSTAVTVVRRALLTGRCQIHTETRAVRLLTNDKKTRIEGVECIGPDGKRITFKADTYVLAASPIEDVRLLLLSGVGNSSDMVGRCLMFHHQTFAIGIFEERIHGHRGRTISNGFSDFRGVPKDPNHPLGGIVEISGGPPGPIEEAAFYARVMRQLAPSNFDGQLFKRLMSQSPAREHLAVLVLQAEDAPQLTNRVDLDPAVKDMDGIPAARITYQNHRFELDASAFYAPKMIELLGASGAKYAFIPPIPDVSESSHIMGTLRMGSNPKTSVCNPAGRLHDVENLYATDGAVFPTSSGYNPTHTIISNACRTAGEMLFPGSPERAITT